MKTAKGRAMGFVDFATTVLGVELTPAQRVLGLVAFDGHEPCDREPADREIARQLFGDVERIPPEARHVLCAVCGARAGKSYVLGALRLLHLALTVPLTTLAPGELAVALIVAPDLRLARQVLRYALGAAESVPSIKDLIGSSTSDGFTLARPDGGTVSVECLPATRGGSAVRGRSLVGAVLDESAFFRDESYQVNDLEVFRAVAPRVLRGGQVVIASTPWAEAGLLFDFHKRNHGHPVDAISAHAPTLLLRDDEHTRSYVAREVARDPQNAAREYGAEFMPAGSDAFFDPRAIDAAVDDALVMPLPKRDHMRFTCGADFGFTRDSSALVVLERDPVRYSVADVVELQPSKGAPLVPSSVVEHFATVVHRYDTDHVIADAHYREAIAEHMSAQKLYLRAAPEGAMGKAESYQIARSLLHEGKVRLPKHERLLRQLREVVARPTPGGGVTITSPRWRMGGHGDLVSALVLALFEAARGSAPTVPAATLQPGSVEARATAWRDRIEQDETRHWRRYDMERAGLEHVHDAIESLSRDAEGTPWR
jgi:hypothetical protein